MNILRFLICCSRIGGQQRLTTKQMTTLDKLFGCYSYVCKDKAEFDQLNAQVVAKQNKRFWCDVDVYNTETKERHKVTDIIGVLVKSPEPTAQPSTYPSLPEFVIETSGPVQVTYPPSAPGTRFDVSQTPGDSQSGGEQSPAESMGTLSPSGDFAAELAANGAAPAADVGAGQEPEQVKESAPAEAPPASTPPAKRKAGRPAKVK